MNGESVETGLQAARGSLPGSTSGDAVGLTVAAISQRALADLALLERGSLIVRGPCEHYHWYPRLPAPHVFVRGAEAGLVELGRRSFAIVVVGWDVPFGSAERIRARLVPETLYVCLRASYYVWTPACPAGRMLPDWNSGEHCPAAHLSTGGWPLSTQLTLHVACWGAGGNELDRYEEECEFSSSYLVDRLLDQHLGSRPRAKPPQRPRPDGSLPRPVVFEPDRVEADMQSPA